MIIFYMSYYIMTTIPLRRILLDRAMRAWVKENADEQGRQLNLKQLPPNYDRCVGQLQQDRIDSLARCEAELPIVVLPYKSTKYYEVVDGRHRVVLAIQNRATAICTELDEEMEPTSRIDNWFK